MKIFSLLALFHNWLADKDFIWWPFSFLRPAANELITMKIVMQMTGCFAGLAFLMFTVLAVANNAFTLEYAVSIFLSSFVGFFLWFSLVTKPLWNKRTKELKG